MRLLKLNTQGIAHHLVLAFIVVGTAIAGTYALIASHADTTNPTDSVVFNNPYGTQDQQYAIINHINSYIDAAPAGSTIRIATYGFTVQSTADKLVSAYQRGVNVKMLFDGSHTSKPQEQQMIQALGTTKTANSFVATCNYGCMSSDIYSIMHVKMYLFSQSGSDQSISMTGSSNITKTNAEHAWNDLETIANDSPVYNDDVKYFTAMLQDQNNPTYSWTASDGNYSMYYYPGSKAQTSTIMNALNNVQCHGAAPGYGLAIGGRTVIRVGMYIWSKSDLDIAQKLWDLDNSGCEVEVLISDGGTVDPSILTTLLQPGDKYGQMGLYNGATANTIVHQKFLAINGVYAGNPKSKVVFSGSANFTIGTVTVSNNIMTQFNSDAMYDAFAKNYRLIRDNYSIKLNNVAQAQTQPIPAAATDDGDESLTAAD